ncbi:MAG: RlmI/RlmK family 23S rRNA methyltransferase [Epsilonproteobacteria bacterium]|nr:MAG: RlmI/RlmK family 23S rRNA methyltransferase [Campylobacterota bacterium]
MQKNLSKKLVNNKYIKIIKSALEYREDLFNDETTSAFRVFNGNGDGIDGLTIDYFNDYYLLTWFSPEIYQERNTIIEALKMATYFKGIYQKLKYNPSGKIDNNSNDFICGTKAPEPLIIKENNVNFAIYLDDGAMVGIFLDQKDVRKTIRDKYSKNKTMLNMFSYTGAFSVYSVLGGAIKTTSVDLAKRSRAKTIEQFEINSIDAKSQNIVVDDVFGYFKYAIKKNLLFDLVVLDPPSFARNKKMTFSVSKDYVNLLKEAIQITSKGGIIVASTNYSKLNMRVFKECIEQSFKELSGKYIIKETFSLPKDFKVLNESSQENYLKVIFIKKLS